jgi:threonine dehydrogenase-like Zn-dependent dehydrogenase
MRAAIFKGPGAVEAGERPDPVIQEPTDAVVRVVLGCVCGSTISCAAGGNFGNGTIDGGQGEAVRVPLAGSTLVPVPGSGHPDAVLRSLLALSDVMSTGHHAAAVAGVRKAPARIYIPELLGDVLDGSIHPGLVFDYETDLDHIADAYRAMDERRAIKSLVRVGAL